MARPIGAGRRAAGFTLIEILVALVIASVLMTVVGLSIRSADRSLRFDAERLAQLLSLAREEALVRGAPIRFEADDLRYRFLIRRAARWQPILDDPDLRVRDWSGPTQVRVERADGGEAIEFGRDVVDAPFAISLARDDRREIVRANGLGVFELQ